MCPGGGGSDAADGRRHCAAAERDAWGAAVPNEVSWDASKPPHWLTMGRIRVWTSKNSQCQSDPGFFRRRDPQTAVRKEDI